MKTLKTELKQRFLLLLSRIIKPILQVLINLAKYIEAEFKASANEELKEVLLKKKERTFRHGR